MHDVLFKHFLVTGMISLRISIDYVGCLCCKIVCIVRPFPVFKPSRKHQTNQLVLSQTFAIRTS